MNADGPVIVADQGNARRSEHGLGHLVSPHDPTRDADPTSFYDQWWTHLLHLELGYAKPDPAWFTRPAIGRLSVTSPNDDKAFRHYNARKRYDDQVKPHNFGICAFPTPGDRARTGSRVLVAPFHRNPRRWNSLSWTDRKHPDQIYRIRTGDDVYIIADTIVVETYGSYFGSYINHPEAKAGGRDEMPGRRETKGVLGPLTVMSSAVLGRVGKETNRVAAETDVAELDEQLLYVVQTCRGCGGSVSTRQTWCGDACRKRRPRGQPAEKY